MAPRQIRALELGCIAMIQGKNFVLALDSTQLYSSQKCMSLRHAQLRIWIRTKKTGTSTFYQTVRLQLQLLENTRSPQNWSETALNFSYRWTNIPEFS
jgi:hypothetical protein